MYKTAIVDDSTVDSQKIDSFVKAWAEQNGLLVHTEIFPSAEAFFFSYEEDKAWDILLLDVEMKEMSGIELARRIRREDSRAEIVFITSHFEFWEEGYEVDALHYLTKPVSMEKLSAVLDRAAAKLEQEPPSVIITCEGKIVKLLLQDILYAEAFSHYITIHTKEQEYRIKESISVFEKKLGDGFFRIHRSYLVALKQIHRISRRSVTICGGVELPLARGNYDAVSRAYIEAYETRSVPCMIEESR